MKKLAIITTHPIQYYASVFKLLAERKLVDVKVFYTWGEAAINKYDPGFNKKINWDIPLLNGYNYEWVKNTSNNPGSAHFQGIINPDLINNLDVYKPDSVLVIGWAYNSHLKVLRHFKNKIPVLFKGDSTLLDEKKGIRSVVRFCFLKWVYWHIDHAFYNGVNNRAYFIKYGLKSHQLSFAPHAVDNERFQTSKVHEAMALRRSLGVLHTDVLILFAGKFEEKKNPLLLMNAFAKLNDPSAHLLFVGNGNLESELKDNAKNHKNIHFIDFQNQTIMPVIYQSCDVFCLPSKGPGETWGLVVNEAMAASKAVLVSDKCGAAIDLVKNGSNGMQFKSDDAGDLLSKLNELLENKQTLADLGKNSYSIIKSWNFLSVVIAIENKLNHG